MEPTEITITFSTFDLFYVMPILNVGGGGFLPTKYISVAEGITSFWGRLSFRIYILAKPTKYSIEVWMATSHSQGYVVNFLAKNLISGQEFTA